MNPSSREEYPAYFRALISRLGNMPGACLMCGMCCRAVSIAQSKEGIGRTIEEELKKLKAEPASRHAAQIAEFINDATFILNHWKQISREEAIKINPFFSHPDFDGQSFYVCDALKDNRCSLHAERPRVCRGYPWYWEMPRESALFHRPCGYEPDIDWAKKAKDTFLK